VIELDSAAVLMPVIEGAVKEVLDKTEWAAIVF